jgi:hypothetical protein
MEAVGDGFDMGTISLPAGVRVEDDLEAAARRAATWSKQWRARHGAPKVGYWRGWGLETRLMRVRDDVVFTDEGRSAQVLVIPAASHNKPRWLAPALALAAIGLCVLFSYAMDALIALMPASARPAVDTVTGLLLGAWLLSHLRLLLALNGSNVAAKSISQRGAIVVGAIANPRRPGAGRRLLAALAQAAETNGIPIVSSALGDSRAELYRRLGFQCDLYAEYLRPTWQGWQRVPIWTVRSASSGEVPPRASAWWRRGLRAILWLVAVVACIGFFVSALPPTDWSGMAACTAQACIAAWILLGEYRAANIPASPRR